jgi:hypothetical protein
MNTQSNKICQTTQDDILGEKTSAQESEIDGQADSGGFQDVLAKTKPANSIKKRNNPL